MNSGRRATVMAMLAGITLLLMPTAALAQDDDTERLATAEARIDELERSVDDLEDRLAVLEGETPAAVSADQEVPPPTPASIAAGDSSREQPIAVGTAGKVGDWSITVLSVSPDAEEEILAENTFNDPPEPGHQFSMVSVALTYQGAESSQAGFDLSFSAVGESNVAYNTYDPGCGVIPDDLGLTDEVFTGGTIEANVCFSVEESDVDSLVMYVDPLFSLDDDRTWFSLHDGNGSSDT